MKTSNVSRKGACAQLLQQPASHDRFPDADSADPPKIAQQLAELLSLINQLYSDGNRSRRISEEMNFAKTE